MRSRRRFYLVLAAAVIVNLLLSTSLVHSNSTNADNRQLTSAPFRIEQHHKTRVEPVIAKSVNGNKAEGPVLVNIVNSQEMSHRSHGRLIESTALVSDALTSSLARLTTSARVPTSVTTSRPAVIVDVAVALGGSVAFLPDEVTIHVGDTIRWTFTEVGHNVVSGGSCIANNQFCSPSDMDCANSQSSPAGAVYTHTFNQAGTFQYFCSPHCFNGMVGTVTVNPVVVQDPVHCDFDGDRKTDVSVFRPANGVWYISQSSNNGFRGDGFGANGDRPAPADYDGDGKTDLAVFRPSTGTFYILQSLGNVFRAEQFGASGDAPVPGDFDGDNKADIAVFRPSNGAWYRLNSSNGAFVAQQWGASSDKPALGDFDGDGKNDLAVFRPSEGTWYILQSLNGFRAQQFGGSTDTTVAADYDGDGKADPAVFRPSEGTFYLLQSASGFRAQQWGANGDIPAPSAFVP